MPMPTGNWKYPQVYGQWTVEDSQNGISTTLKLVVFVNFKTSQPTNISGRTEGTALNGDLSNPQINENFLIWLKASVLNNS